MDMSDESVPGAHPPGEGSEPVRGVTSPPVPRVDPGEPGDDEIIDVPIGVPIPDEEFRQLKEQARTRGDADDNCDA